MEIPAAPTTIHPQELLKWIQTTVGFLKNLHSDGGQMTFRSTAERTAMTELFHAGKIVFDSDLGQFYGATVVANAIVWKLL